MSDIVTVRDPDIIAAEINVIKREVREVAIRASIRIGEKLTEAKSLVDHGQWGTWLEENVEYSQSTANYLMQLYQEYGSGQENLFDTWTNSQTFAKLSYSKHVALLTLPFGERQEFAEAVNAEDLSTRQLQQAIREHEEKLREAERKLEDQGLEMEALKDSAAEQMQRMEAEAGEERRKTDAYKAQAESAEAAKARAEKSEANALKLAEDCRKKLQESEEREQKAREELKKARENPNVPDALMEQLRKEMENEAAQKASARLKKQLDAAEAAAKEAAREREVAEAAAREALDKLAAVQKDAKFSNPDMAVFKMLFEQVQTDFNRLMGAYKKVSQADPEAGEKLKKAVQALLSKCGEGL